MFASFPIKKMVKTGNHVTFLVITQNREVRENWDVFVLTKKVVLIASKLKIIYFVFCTRLKVGEKFVKKPKLSEL